VTRKFMEERANCC